MFVQPTLHKTIGVGLLDRNGQPLAVPVNPVPRDQDGLRFVSVEGALAPLAPADYVLEVSVTRDGQQQKTLVGFRLVT